MIHDARHFPELATYLVDDTASGTTHGLHGHGTKQERHQPADQQTDQHHVIIQREVHYLVAVLGERMGVVGKQYQCGQRSRTNGVTLGDRLGGVAHGIQRVGDIAYLLVQFSHLGNATGIVSDGAVGVEGHDNAGHGQHGRGGNGDAIDTGQLKRAPDAGTDDKDWQGSGLHGHTQAGDDVGAVTGSGGLGDVAHRLELGAGVVLGNDHQGRGQCQANQGAVVQHAGAEFSAVERDRVTQYPGRDRVEGDGGEDAGDDQSTVQGVHDLGALGGFDEEGADDGGDNRDTAKYQRIECRRAGGIQQQAAQQHGGDHRHGIGLEQISGHTGTVADVVTDVVGNHGRVAWVVFRNTGLDLADDVGADISALGEDAAAESCEDGDQGTAEGQAYQRVYRILDTHGQQQAVEAGHADHAQSNHQHAGDGTAAEGNLQGGIDAVMGCLGSAHI